MSQPKSITVKKVAPNTHEIRGCTYPHKALLIELGAEWQGRALCWMWHGDKLPTALQDLADGVYGLEALKTGQTSVLATTTPKPVKKPIAPKPSDTAPQISDTPNLENRKFKVGDRVMSSNGARTGGIVQGYNGQHVIVHFGTYKYDDWEESDLTADTKTVYLDQLKVGSVVEWTYHNPKGVDLPYKAKVSKVNPKTVTIIAEESKGLVEHTVKVESLRWLKVTAETETPKPTEAPTWETKIIHVTTNKGTNPITADVYGTVAIHRKVDEADHAFAPWVMTHVESGMSVVSFDEAWMDGLRLRPLAEQLHLIDIRQLWLDQKEGKLVKNQPIIDQIKTVVNVFRTVIEVAKTVHEELD